MGYIARFTKGARRVDIDGVTLCLGKDFIPPAVQTTPLIATGTAANARRGGVKRGESANDRQWAFMIYARGNSEAQCRMLLHPVLSLLSEAGDEGEPLYFEYRGNDNVSAEPTWGQYGANIRYEITHANKTEIWPVYAEADTKSRAVHYRLDLLIKPYQIGKPQRLASATGGILENTYGTADGRSRGLVIPVATTNKITNPIFGAGVTTGWTASGLMLAALNSDPEYVMFGDYSVRLVNRGATSNTYTMSIAAGNTNDHSFSAYVKLPDGGVVTAGMFSIYYDGSASPTNVTALGDGWYFLDQTIAGVVGATTVGLEISEDQNCYLAGMQMEQGENPTPMCYGDLLGHSWATTAHASTSTRTVARARVALDATNYNPGQGTVRMVWNPALGTTLATSVYLWATDTYSLYYDWSDQKFKFQANAVTVQSAVYTLQEDGTDPIVIHCTWGADGCALAVQGVRTTSASFGAGTADAYLYIGSETAAGNHCRGTFADLAIYNHPFTAAEITADANNILAHITGGDGLGQQLTPIPWLWTKDGDDVVDNADDSSRDNWIVCGGIPGNMAADTTVITASSNAFDTFSSIYLSNWTLSRFYAADALFFHDLSGTADATAAGGEFSRVSVSTSETSIASATITDNEGKRELLGRSVTAFCRVKDAGASTLQLALRVTSGGHAATSEFVTVTTATAYRLFVAGTMTVPSASDLMLSSIVNPGQLSFNVRAKRPTGVSTGNVDTDYMAIFVTPTQITNGDSSDLGIVYRGTRAIGVGSTSFPGAIVSQSGPLAVRGGVIELYPQLLNLVMSLQGDASVNPLITWTMTYYIYVTPRWLLI